MVYIFWHPFILWVFLFLIHFSIFPNAANSNLPKNNKISSLLFQEFYNLSITPSPYSSENYDERNISSFEVPCFIILHNTAYNKINNVLKWFGAPNSLASAHYVIGPTPINSELETEIFQVIPNAKRAWHAGNGHWNNIDDINSYSIGIEFVNSGQSVFTDYQYKAAAKLCVFLMLKYNIPPTNILAHAEVAPLRKSDPNSYFSWGKLFRLIEAEIYKLEVQNHNNIALKKISQEISLLANTYALYCNNYKQIIFSSKAPNSLQILKLKQDLKKLGYNLSLLSEEYDYELQAVVVAFNRKYCPEIFIPETMDEKNIIHSHSHNYFWYALSAYRLDYLLSINSTYINDLPISY